eukprot:1311456-Rhodomonas_salina.3
MRPDERCNARGVSRKDSDPPLLTQHACCCRLATGCRPHSRPRQTRFVGQTALFEPRVRDLPANVLTRGRCTWRGRRYKTVWACYKGNRKSRGYRKWRRYVRRSSRWTQRLRAGRRARQKRHAYRNRRKLWKYRVMGKRYQVRRPPTPTPVGP